MATESSLRIALSCESTNMAYLVFDTSAPIRRIFIGDDCLTKSQIEQKAGEYLNQLFGRGTFDFYLVHNGKLLNQEPPQGDIHVIPRLLGGKGGFGSMLRAIGAQIEKTTNREACRDLSGRRLRDINEEKRLKKWLAEQAEREQEALERKRKKLEKLNKDIKHEFKDEEYTKARLEMSDKIYEAVEEGLKAATTSEPSTSKELAKSEDIPAVEPKNKRKKKEMKGKLWVDDLLEDSESGADSCSGSDEESPKKKIKLSE